MDIDERHRPPPWSSGAALEEWLRGPSDPRGRGGREGRVRGRAHLGALARMEPCAGRCRLGRGGLACGVRGPRRHRGRATGVPRGHGRSRGTGPINVIGVANIAPAILEAGTQQQKDRFLAPMPAATRSGVRGCRSRTPVPTSASLRTTAVADGDEFVIDGQKTWNSLGHHADWCQLYVRTDSSVPSTPASAACSWTCDPRGSRPAPSAP